MGNKFSSTVVTLACLIAASVARAEITVGISTGATGPGASLGIHVKNAFQLVPKTIGGESVKYILLDDGTDPTNAAKNARKLVSEDKVDLLMGSSSVPTSLQLAQIAAETKTPLISLSPASLAPDSLRWVFIVPQSTELMMGAVAEHAKAQRIKTIGYIGFADAWGNLVYKATESFEPAAGYKIISNERYARADTSVTGQILKIMSGKPDAVVVGGSGTGGALPNIALIERGYKGPIYHNHGTVNAEFIKVGAKAVEGAIAPTGPLVVAEELPDNAPTKAVSLDFVKRYEAAFGANSRNGFAGYAYDGVLLLNAAAPNAMKSAKPGTPEFREALRSALENVKNIVGTHGVYNLSPSDHNGLDERARVLVRVENGAWRLLK